MELFYICFFFFFQAEDGIRDIGVTGVQTCALPIFTGKAYGVPVYKLMGGPTRDRVRVYGTPNAANGVNAMKVLLRGNTRQPFKYNEGQKMVDEIVERFKALREKMGPDVDIGVEFHGAVQPPTAMVLMKALEPYDPWFYEEVVQALNIELMAELAKKTHVPLATEIGRAHV